MSRADRTTGGMAALWLGLVEQRCLKLAADRAELAMDPAERVKLLDAAMKTADATAYLDGMARTFVEVDRRGDAVLAAVLRGLTQAGEIETLMFMRAKWQDSGDASFPNPDLAL